MSNMGSCPIVGKNEDVMTISEKIVNEVGFVAKYYW